MTTDCICSLWQIFISLFHLLTPKLFTVLIWTVPHCNLSAKRVIVLVLMTFILLAVGVPDILPLCVSSVYLFYDPGTLTSLLKHLITFRSFIQGAELRILFLSESLHHGDNREEEATLSETCSLQQMQHQKAKWNEETWKERKGENKWRLNHANFATNSSSRSQNNNSKVSSWPSINTSDGASSNLF